LLYLEEAFLIKKIYNFSRNRITSEKKSKKFYLSSTSFFPYLHQEIDESRIMENLIATEINSRFFWRTPQKDEVDFILEDNKISPLEVKYKNKISDKDIKTTIKFCKKFKLDEGIIITKDTNEKRIFTKENTKIIINLIPAWEFLLFMDKTN